LASTSNTLNLRAVLSAMQALRYTPGGVAMIDAVLSHSSSQTEAGVARQVEFELGARFADRAAERLSRTPLGSALALQGYLAPRRRGSKSLLFHVIDFRTDSPSGTA
jgi:primosomal replication protein N